MKSIKSTVADWTKDSLAYDVIPCQSAINCLYRDSKKVANLISLSKHQQKKPRVTTLSRSDYFFYIYACTQSNQEIIINLHPIQRKTLNRRIQKIVLGDPPVDDIVFAGLHLKSQKALWFAWSSRSLRNAKCGPWHNLPSDASHFRTGVTILGGTHEISMNLAFNTGN